MNINFTISPDLKILVRDWSPDDSHYADYESLFAAIKRFIKLHAKEVIPTGHVGLLMADGAHLTQDGEPTVRLRCARYDRALAEREGLKVEAVPTMLYQETQHLWELAESNRVAPLEVSKKFFLLIHRAVGTTHRFDHVDALIARGSAPVVTLLHIANDHPRCEVLEIAVAKPPGIVS